MTALDLRAAWQPERLIRTVSGHTGLRPKIVGRSLLFSRVASGVKCVANACRVEVELS
jgi:hypothetical protein